MGGKPFSFYKIKQTNKTEHVLLLYLVGLLRNIQSNVVWVFVHVSIKTHQFCLQNLNIGSLYKVALVFKLTHYIIRQ